MGGTLAVSALLAHGDASSTWKTCWCVCCQRGGDGHVNEDLLEGQEIEDIAVFISVQGSDNANSRETWGGVTRLDRDSELERDRRVGSE